MRTPPSNNQELWRWRVNCALLDLRIGSLNRLLRMELGLVDSWKNDSNILQGAAPMYKLGSNSGKTILSGNYKTCKLVI
jgi:hypothetical protein